jgi:hypothetical protein
VGPGASRLQNGDVLVQVQVQLPVAGTWRVTAGLENSMLLHIGDVVALDSAAEVLEGPVSSSVSTETQPRAVSDGSGNTGLQQNRLQLPEVLGDDHDERVVPAAAPSSATDDEAADADGLGFADGAAVQHVLCVQGAGLLDAVSENSAGEAAFSYTHSGDFGARCCCDRSRGCR